MSTSISPSRSASISPSASTSRSSSLSESSSISQSASESPSGSASPSIPVEESEPVFNGMNYDGVHAVIKHAENLLYDMFYGEPCYIVKKKGDGARCTNCWSESRQQRTLTHCDVCHGSGYLDGYYPPILAQIAFDSDERKSDSQKNFEDVYNSIRARMSNTPIVRPKDLIININDYKRYVILFVETTKLPMMAQSGIILSGQNHVVSQMLTLQELNPDDNEYALDITTL